MRIRKNAKISPLVYPASSPNAGAVIQTHVCQLNQSPWDVMSFSPPASPPPQPPLPLPSQVNKNDVSAGNGCSPENNVPAVERKFSANWECESIDGDASNEIEEQEQPHVGKDDDFIFWSKSDGKSWQCRHKAAKENLLSEHHLYVAKNKDNLTQSKNLEKSDVEARRPSRPKKAPASTSSSNPNQFYYYSGFGPNWRRRRGESSKNNSDMSENVEQEHEFNTLLLSQFDEDTDAEDEYQNGDKGKKRGRKPSKARPLNSLM